MSNFQPRSVTMLAGDIVAFWASSLAWLIWGDTYFAPLQCDALSEVFFIHNWLALLCIVVYIFLKHNSMSRSFSIEAVYVCVSSLISFIFKLVVQFGIRKYNTVYFYEAQHEISPTCTASDTYKLWQAIFGTKRSIDESQRSLCTQTVYYIIVRFYFSAFSRKVIVLKI